MEAVGLELEVGGVDARDAREARRRSQLGLAHGLLEGDAVVCAANGAEDDGKRGAKVAAGSLDEGLPVQDQSALVRVSLGLCLPRVWIRRRMQGPRLLHPTHPGRRAGRRGEDSGHQPPQGAFQSRFAQAYS